MRRLRLGRKAPITKPFSDIYATECDIAPFQAEGKYLLPRGSAAKNSPVAFLVN
jgi:hypothetical protein